MTLCEIKPEYVTFNLKDIERAFINDFYGAGELWLGEGETENPHKDDVFEPSWQEFINSLVSI